MTLRPSGGGGVGSGIEEKLMPRWVNKYGRRVLLQSKVRILGKLCGVPLVLVCGRLLTVSHLVGFYELNHPFHYHLITIWNVRHFN